MGQARAKALRSKGPGEGETASLAAPHGCARGHVSGVQSRWAPALMAADGEGEGEGQEELGVGETAYGRKRPRSWTWDGSLLGQKINAPRHSGSFKITGVGSLSVRDFLL